MSAPRPLYSPELKKGKIWRVEYYIQPKDVRRRVRISRTKDGIELNAIEDLAERERVGMAMVADIKARISPPDTDPGHILFVEALHVAVSLKRSNKEATNKCFRETARWVAEYFTERGWQHLRCSQINKEHLQAYFDHIIVRRKVRNSTHNTRKNNLRALLAELVRRKHIPENFAAQIKDRPEADPIRRTLTDDEKRLLFREAFRQDKPLALAMVLLGFLAIRPGEIRNLKVSALDLERGVVRFPPNYSKNNRNSVVTIPAEAIPLLRSFGVHEYPGAYYLFGKAKGRHNCTLAPAPDRIGVNTLSHKFRVLVGRLHREGVLQDVRGIQLYSLKDTLAIYLLDSGVDVETAMRHFRQSDLGSFQRYVKRLGLISEKIRAVRLDIEVPKE